MFTTSDHVDVVFEFLCRCLSILWVGDWMITFVIIWYATWYKNKYEKKIARLHLAAIPIWIEQGRVL